jgi:hypothetical protein
MVLVAAVRDSLVAAKRKTFPLKSGNQHVTQHTTTTLLLDEYVAGMTESDIESQDVVCHVDVLQWLSDPSLEAAKNIRQCGVRMLGEKNVQHMGKLGTATKLLQHMGRPLRSTDHHATTVIPNDVMKSLGVHDVATCPITLDVMDDPVVAGDGFTYQKSAIEAWLAHSDKSPVTGKSMDTRITFPNRALRSVLHGQLLSRYGVDLTEHTTASEPMTSLLESQEEYHQYQETIQTILATGYTILLLPIPMLESWVSTRATGAQIASDLESLVTAASQHGGTGRDAATRRMVVHAPQFLCVPPVTPGLIISAVAVLVRRTTDACQIMNKLLICFEGSDVNVWHRRLVHICTEPVRRPPVPPPERVWRFDPEVWVQNTTRIPHIHPEGKVPIRVKTVGQLEMWRTAVDTCRHASKFKHIWRPIRNGPCLMEIVTEMAKRAEEVVLGPVATATVVQRFMMERGGIPKPFETT